MAVGEWYQKLRELLLCYFAIFVISVMTPLSLNAHRAWYVHVLCWCPLIQNSTAQYSAWNRFKTESTIHGHQWREIYQSFLWMFWSFRPLPAEWDEPDDSEMVTLWAPFSVTLFSSSSPSLIVLSIFHIVECVWTVLLCIKVNSVWDWSPFSCNGPIIRIYIWLFVRWVNCLWHCDRLSISCNVCRKGL